jgi:hypothetical protein
MKSQWECFLQNLGVWEGSFTNFSPKGELLQDTPSILALEGLNNNQKVRLTLRRFPMNEPVNEMVLEYQSVGGGLLFFENGAFSQGSIQLAPFTEFGAELAVIHENHRLRLVQLFNKSGELDKLTLIREHLAGTDSCEKPTFTVNDLVGKWQGEAVTIYSDLRSPDSYTSTLEIQIDDAGRLIQQLSFGGRTITSNAKVDGSIILFDGEPQKQVQVLLLPDGASATSPLKVQLRQPLFLEVGWLVEPNLRQRLIRSYNDKGEWVSLTLVKERRV